jgi:hypothetical protein
MKVVPAPKRRETSAGLHSGTSHKTVLLKQRQFLNSINRLGFVADTLCVSCEVRTGFLYITEKKSKLYVDINSDFIQNIKISRPLSQATVYSHHNVFIFTLTLSEV